jgi:hypothetical protein
VRHGPSRRAAKRIAHGTVQAVCILEGVGGILIEVQVLLELRKPLFLVAAANTVAIRSPSVPARLLL